MKVKASFHLHSGDDKVEGELFDYDTFALIDEAASLGFSVLALTCHHYLVAQPEHQAYAKQHGILLMPGVELNLQAGNRHGDVLVINCPPEVDQLKTFADLVKFKKSHPEILVIAAHPNFGFGSSMGLEVLQQYLAVFDAVEISWFYGWGFNLNKASLKIAKAASKPVVATSDLHYFNWSCLGTDYCCLDLDQLTPAAVVAAVRAGHFDNVTRPKTWWYLFISAWQVFWSGKIMAWKRWRRRQA